MPELPEVEVTARDLHSLLAGDEFTGVRNSWPNHIATPSVEALQERISGLRVEKVGRRGKYLLFTLSEGETLIIHLRMSGHLSVVPGDEPLRDHTHTVFSLASGRELRFRNPRKFGRVYLVNDPAQVVGNLGPEPLAPTFSVERFQERLRGRSGRLKSLLLDQTFIAGVGNIYADEALYYARLHPLRRANTLQLEEATGLYEAIQKVLQMGIERDGASIDRFMKPDGSKGEMQNAVSVYKLAGSPCARCGTPIARIVVSGRSTHFCPHCQPDPEEK